MTDETDTQPDTGGWESRAPDQIGASLSIGPEDDDAQQTIADAPPGSEVDIAPGVYEITPPFDIPPGVTLRGAAGIASTNYKDVDGEPVSAPVTFVKMGDGAHATIGSSTTIMGIEFDGNRANYAGPGIVDRHSYVHFTYMERVGIRFQRGHGRVQDAQNKATYEATKIAANGGWGLVNTTTGPYNVHHTRFENGSISNNDAGGILYRNESEGHVPWDERYRTRIQGNGGPGVATVGFVGITATTFANTMIGNDGAAYHFAGERRHGPQLSISGKAGQSAGPFVLAENGWLRNVRVSATHVKNAQSPDPSLTPPVGEYHFALAKPSSITLINDQYGQRTPETALMTNTTDPVVRVQALSPNAKHGGRITGNIQPLVLGQGWDDVEFDTPRGLRLRQGYPAPRLDDPTRPGALYIGARDEPPADDAPERSLYFDTGEGRDDESPGWRYAEDGEFRDV